MITEDLLNYIKHQNAKNVSKELIISQLISVGWRMEDINEGLKKAIPSIPHIDTQSTQSENQKSYTVDPYHESIDNDTEIKKIWIPSLIKPVEDKKEEELEIEQIKKTEAIVNPASTRAIETFQKELNKPQEQPKLDPIKVNIDNIKPKPIPEKVEKVEKAEMIPTLIEKPKVENSLSKIAMISSYSKDYVSASNLKKEVSKRKKNTFSKWLIAILIILILGATAFALEGGYLKIPNIKIPFIKKEAKTILLNSATNFAYLKSYKVETEVGISLPSFANITSSLMQGEPVISGDKESFYFKTKGEVNKSDPSSSFFNYDIVLNSSMIENEIKTNLKFDKINSYINIPNLTQVLKENTPPAGLVSVPNEKINQMKVILPVEMQEKINNVDLSKLIPNNSVNYISNQFISAFKNFVGNIEMIRKGEQEIHGVDTYHYSVNVDRSSLKKLLEDVSGALFVGMSDGSKINMEEILGSVSVNSFEIWIGKKDENVYQYKFTLTVPLSKIIRLEDKGIADSEVTINWHTTYYDLDVHNNTNLSGEIINFDDFIKSFEDIKIKNVISSFSSSAQIMKNALGNYGKKSNSTGSCSEPAPGSLFSPLGHTKGASTVVGTIASTMNTVINQTNGVSSCYSTSKAWAIASPLASDPNSYFCVDSEGNSITLLEPLTKTTCQ